ncbi:ATP-binding protein [Pseudomonas cichorii]|nr:ATP-binding protein [Pseudomonas cichorii]MBX8538335.1 ATP-binding protein [Pseudomonas cichorii]MBX8578229.1 ATP-binding protein [Pseudomonas cichorii]MBX8603840.1 ATP-binding protein [Pseudomonas cichorii]
MTSLKMRVQSHILKLLGDQLIGHDRLAVFELVKNSYDADASKVDVTLSLDSATPFISIEDDGCGMSLLDIESKWLEVGTDSKRGISGKKFSPKYKRLPLGEKGVGRLAIQKLGRTVNVITKSKNGSELEFTINWDDLVGGGKYLDQGLSVSILTNSPSKVFKSKTGTKLTITDLSREEWSKRDVRDLYRLITSLGNPINKIDSFDVELHLPGREEDIKNLPSAQKMLDAAMWTFDFSISENGFFSWDYVFNPPAYKGLKPFGDGRVNDKLELVKVAEEDSDDPPSIFLSSEMLQDIGPIKGKIYAYHRRTEILKESGSAKLISDWIKYQSGIRVYRDQVRVFNYGEPGDDWLGLNVRRINRPAGKLGTDSLLGYIDINLASSSGLKEKTNREGFDENATYKNLQRAVLSVFDKFERLHGPHRKEIDKAIKGEAKIVPVEEAFDSLKEIAKKNNLELEIKPVVESLQTQLNSYRTVMLNSGMAGLNLSLAFHEMVHGVDTLTRQLEADSGKTTLEQTVTNLRKLLDTFKPLLNKERARKVTAKELMARSLDMNSGRFKRHDLVLSNRVLDGGVSFPISGPLNLLMGAINNIIDNAIYWARYQAQKDNKQGAVLIMSDWDEERKCGSLAIIDNGPGFELPLDQLGTPFVSNRAEGMGLGLYYSKMVMESVGGSLVLCSAEELREDFDFSDAYDGAAVIFQFKEEK